MLDTFFLDNFSIFLRRPFRGTKKPWAENHPCVLYRGGLCLPGGAEWLWASCWCTAFLLFWFGLPFLTLKTGQLHGTLRRLFGKTQRLKESDRIRRVYGVKYEIYNFRLRECPHEARGGAVWRVSEVCARTYDTALLGVQKGLLLLTKVSKKSLEVP